MDEGVPDSHSTSKPESARALRISGRETVVGGKKLMDLLKTEIRIDLGSTDNRARAPSI